MKITAICPTYRHPNQLANSVALWNRQSYPLEDRFLLIHDNGGTFWGHSHNDDRWRLMRTDRLESLPATYNRLLADAFANTFKDRGGPDAIAIWEDDDLYLHDYIAMHVACLRDNELSRPRFVLGDYSGEIRVEESGGRFHSSLAFRRELIERVGGWPLTRRADFDQQLIQRLMAQAVGDGEPFKAPFHDSLGLIQYVYSWHTGDPHGQSCMKSPDDCDWWDRAPDIYTDYKFRGVLVPNLDDRARGLGYLDLLQYSPGVSPIVDQQVSATTATTTTTPAPDRQTLADIVGVRSAGFSNLAIDYASRA